MEYLVIYDETGKIYFMASGDTTPPQGLPYLLVTVPISRALIGIDVSGETPTPILQDVAPSETHLLQEQVTSLQNALAILNDTLLEQMGL